ncbi:hypothetical protein M3Y97_00169800 [Aphelenchoides bicaudatus]|nr:hypothetical protein M3Y97_00169800 [Aphelenchoides bicaudatus]
MHLAEVPASEFPLLLNHFLNYNCYLSTRTSLAFYLQGLLDRTRLRVWSVKDGDFEAYGMVHLMDNRSNRIVLESNTTNIGFSVAAAHLLATKIYEHVKNHLNLFIYCTEVSMALQLEKYFASQQTHPYKRLEENHINYYSNKAQRAFLENEDISLPEGFRFEQLKSKDLEDILRDQAIYKNANIELSRLRLERLPSAAIYHIESGELACFETVDGIGYVAPRFTRCKYSTYRLCAYVERLIAKKCWTLHGVVPAKSIGFQNTYCIEYSDKSPIWTKLLDERGCAVAKQYLILSNEPGVKIEFFESCVNW